MNRCFPFLPTLLSVTLGTAGLCAQGTRQGFDSNGNLASASAWSAALPIILSHPVSQAVQAGNPVALSVVASGGAVTCQWKKNGADIGGATLDTLTITSFAVGDEGSYTVVVTNATGSTTSSPALLEIDSDADGLPDSWEMTAFGDLASDGGDNFDFDDRTNLEEYLDGTDAVDWESQLVQLTLTGVNGIVTATPASATGRYEPVTLVTLTGSPAAGYEVSSWINATPTGPNQATILLGFNDETVTATFRPIATPVDFATALDDSNGLVLTSGGEQPWVGETGGGAHDGVDSARSGDISRYGESWIETSVTGPGSLSFWWRTSCNSADGMTLLVDGMSLATLTGEKPWQPVNMAIPAGAHTLRWRFVRGSAGSLLNSNRVWLDQLLWQAGGVPELAEAMDQTGSVIATGGVSPWQTFSRFVPLAVTGFDFDVVVGSGDVAGVAGSVWTAVTTTDFGTSTVPVLRETAGSTGGVYLPAGGLLTALDGEFQMESDAANNALRVGPLDTRTLTLTTPAAQRAIRLLALSAGDDSELMCELDFTDGTRQSSVVLFREWTENLDNSWPVALFSRDR